MSQSIGRRREAAAPPKGKGNSSPSPSATTTGVLVRPRNPIGRRPAPPAAAAASCRPSKGKESPRPPPARRPLAAVSPTPESRRKGVSTFPVFDQLRRLELEERKLVELEMLKSNYETPAYLEKIIDFVNTLLVAHHYFDFKDYLSAFCGRDRYDFTDSTTTYTLFTLPEQLNMFDKLSPEDIGSAVNAHTFDMRHIIFDQRDRELQYRRENRIASERRLTAQDYEAIVRIPTKHRSEEDDTYAFSNPIFVSALQARKGDHVMHEYPEVELQNVKNSVKYFQNYYFCRESWEPTWKSSKTETDAEKVENVTNKIIEACRKYYLLSCYCENLLEATNAAKGSVIPASDANDKAAKGL